MPVEVTDVRECDAYEGETPIATLSFDGEANVFIKDFCWGLRCVLQDGIAQKFAAGCNFIDGNGRGMERVPDDTIIVNVNDTGFTLTKDRAIELIEEYRPDLRDDV